MQAIPDMGPIDEKKVAPGRLAGRVMRVGKA